jgi:FAD-dependent oxidoreductase domain-containing protein 1
MTDVLVIGGGLVGSSTGWHLAREGVDVTVVEPDPTYALAATPRSSGGVRQLFSLPECILLSQYTLELIRDWPEVGWQPNGYLFISGPDRVDALRASYRIHRAHGVRAVWLEPDELARRYPELVVTDLAGAILSPDDGWLDPHALHTRIRESAKASGARFVRDRVSGLSVDGTRVDRVDLESGTVLRPGHVVNAAGIWAADIAAAAGMPVPVEPMRRFEHFVDTRADLSGLPFVKDPAGLAIRPEGAGLSVGLVDFDHPGGFDPEVEPGGERIDFERRVWPALVERVPALDEVRRRSTLVGWYDQNRLDGNPVIGNWPGRLDNLHLACGFSGHGLMHAPGVGRGLTELIVHGEYRTIDLSRLGYERILTGSAYHDPAIR